MFDRMGALEKSLERQIGFVRAAESRVAFLMSALTLSLGVWIAGFHAVEIGVASVIIGCLALILLICSFYNLWLSLYPNMRGPKNSLIYFGGITDRPLEDFYTCMMDVSEEDYRADLVEQIYVNAEIAKKKFKQAKLAMFFWFGSLVPLTIFLVLSIEGLLSGS
ncbi:MAG: Pycsar system effector family protein [Pseudomonadota bacterium]